MIHQASIPVLDVSAYNEEWIFRSIAAWAGDQANIAYVQQKIADVKGDAEELGVFFKDASEKAFLLTERSLGNLYDTSWLRTLLDGVNWSVVARKVLAQHAEQQRKRQRGILTWVAMYRELVKEVATGEFSWNVLKQDVHMLMRGFPWLPRRMILKHLLREKYICSLVAYDNAYKKHFGPYLSVTFQDICIGS